jgi:tetratricopeptide (TPR) repeat protein
MRFLKIYSIIIFLLISSFTLAQDFQIDVLKLKLRRAKEDTSKVNILNSLSQDLYTSEPQEALLYSLEAKLLADKLDYKNGKAYALKYTGLAYYIQGEYVQVIVNWEEALKIFEEIDDKNGIANMLSNLGAVYNNQGNDAKALELYVKSLDLAKEINDTIRRITTFNNIGLVYSKKVASENIALENYHKALELSNEVNYYHGIATATLNIGELYYQQNKYNEALEFLNKSFVAYKIINSIHITDALTYIGKVYVEMEDYDNAIKNQKQSFDIAKEMGAQLEMAKALLGMAETYQKLGNENKALKYFKEAVGIAKSLDAKYLKLDAYKGLADSYAGISDYKKAYEYLNLVTVLKDTIFSDRNQELINNTRVKYEIEGMQQENEILKKDIEIREVRNKTQRLVIFFLILGFIVTSIQTALLYRANRQKRKANNILKDKNDVIFNQKKEIMDSITYAKRIQVSTLPDLEEFKSDLSDIFVLFKPKDVVSGDFYWLTKVEDKIIVAAADCTGHGVPGAFMSMLGAASLNVIVNKEYVTHTGVILRKLRKEVIRALQQKGERGEQRDGMDISLCTIDMDKKELQFSGANNPIYIVRKSNLPPVNGIEAYQAGNYSLYEIKGDKMPVGFYVKMDKYRDHEIKLYEDDMIYMFSDGYADQFGGPKGKKFKYKPFKDLLLSNADKSFTQQNNIFESTIDLWKKDYEQIDDILVLGFKV